MRKISLFIVVIIFFVSALNAQITIIENSSERLVLEWKIKSIDTTSVSTKKGKFTIPSFKGQNEVIGKYKAPLAPAYSFMIGVPWQGDVSVSLQPEQISSMHLSHPLQNQSDSTSQVNMQFQSEWICNPLYSKVGNLRIAHLIVKPFVYDSSTATSSVLLNGKITIEYPVSNGAKTGFSELSMSSMMKKLLLNFSIAQNWGAPKKLGKKAVEEYPLSDRSVYFKIGDGHLGLNEGTINENGIIKITGASIVKTFGSFGGVAIAHVALYASQKGMLPVTPPENGVVPEGITEVPLLRYDHNGNGLVDSSDYILAYVSSLSDWTFTDDFYYQIDNYDEMRTYWLTVKNQAGLTLGKFTQPIGNVSIVNDYFINRIFCKQSRLLKTNSEGGNDWVWAKLSTGGRFDYTFDLPLIDTLYPGKMRINSFRYSNLSVFFANTELVTDVPFSYLYSIPKWGNRNLSINCLDTNYFEISSVEFTYRSKLLLESENIRMPIFSSNDSGIISYTLSNPSKQKIYLFRITNDENEISLVDTFTTNSYTWADSGKKGIRYFACNDSSFNVVSEFASPASIQESKYLVNDLMNRKTMHKADYMIITHPDFLAESQQLAAHKEKMGFKNPVVVSINDIYRYFSGGNKDPTAIRNFLSYVKAYWTDGSELFYVVLMGSGHYDPKHYQTQETDFIPIYQKGDILTEDYFAYTEYDLVNQLHALEPQLVIGRFPVKTKAEASVMVNKVIDMEDPERADFGAWRNRALLIADDDMQGDKTDPIMRSRPHYLSSDRIADIISNKWPSLDMRKAYLFDFEWNAALEKPGATHAILNEINNGVAYVNFFGHGSEVLWADEHILTNDNVSSMNNNKQYPIITSFSCDVGKFDEPGKECLSSVLVKASSAGACAAISSTRLAYANDNEDLATLFYSSLFDSSSTNIGIAYYVANVKCVNAGHHSYAFFGDPSLQFVRPAKNIEFKVTNLKDSIIDTLQALQQIKVSGSILNYPNLIDTDFGNGSNGYIKIGLFNASDSTSRKDGGTEDYRYPVPGTPVFLGITPVHNGKFEQIIFLPKNVSFEKPGVKLTGYAWKEKDPNAAIGAKMDLIFSGSVSNNSHDSTGPRISIRPVYEDSLLNPEKMNVSFSDRISSSLPMKFQIDLYDESGIDVAGSGPDEGLNYEIANVLSKRNINSKFQFNGSDIREGSVPVEIEKNTIKPGIYELSISARDIIGNITIKKITLEVITENEITLDHVFNYPNPFKMGQTTRFFFYPSNTTSNFLPVMMYLRIYSLSGRLLRVFTHAHNGVVWDGRDQVGNNLSPNVYLYQVIAYNSLYQKITKSKIKKVVILPPR